MLYPRQIQTKYWLSFNLLYWQYYCKRGKGRVPTITKYSIFSFPCSRNEAKCGVEIRYSTRNAFRFQQKLSKRRVLARAESLTRFPGFLCPSWYVWDTEWRKRNYYIAGRTTEREHSVKTISSPYSTLFSFRDIEWNLRKRK